MAHQPRWVFTEARPGTLRQTRYWDHVTLSPVTVIPPFDERTERNIETMRLPPNVKALFVSVRVPRVNGGGL